MWFLGLADFNYFLDTCLLCLEALGPFLNILFCLGLVCGFWLNLSGYVALDRFNLRTLEVFFVSVWFICHSKGSTFTAGDS